MSTQNTIIGILAGAAAGAIAGILLAPDKGENTRAKIADKAKVAKDDLADNVDILLEKVSEKYEEIKKAGEELAQTGKVKMAKVKEELAS